MTMSKIDAAELKKWAYPIALAVWLALFSYATISLGIHSNSLANAGAQFDSDSAHLALNAKTALEMGRGIQADSKELDFLNGILKIYPDAKGYLRTQKVMSDEIQELRKEVGRRIGGKLHIVVDSKANKLYFKRGLDLVFEADCSVGRGGTLFDKKTGRKWEFATPRGEFKILRKIDKPVWTKPDWAFVESKETVPPPDDPSRKVEGELGKYVLDIGDGYLIHGTKTRTVWEGRLPTAACVWAPAIWKNFTRRRR